MAKYYTKVAKLANVLEKEKYCELIQNSITAMENRVAIDKKNFANFELAMHELELFELKKKLKINQEIAADFRNDYEVVFLPAYEKRIEECFQNFDEVYDYMLKNIDKIPKTDPFYLQIMAYPTENPDNKDEDLMLLFYEKIKGAVNILKKADNKPLRKA